MNKVLAIIPARGGSKGLPGKNIKNLNGQPLIAWTINAALQAKCIDKVFVSTDDQEIADIAKDFGAEIPWMRPDHLASDDSSIIDTVLYDLDKFESEMNYTPDYIALLQPTSPLRTAQDIDDAFNFLQTNKTSSIVSMTETSEHPYIMKTLTDSGMVKDFIPVPFSPKKMNRQNFPTVYVLNGAIYMIQTEVFKEHSSFLIRDTKAFLMAKEHSVDIDSAFDLKFADFLMKNSK